MNSSHDRARVVAALMTGAAWCTHADAQITKAVLYDQYGYETHGTCYAASISDDGRFVAFDTNTDELLAADGNNAFDVYVRELSTGALARVSVSSAGVEGNRDSYLVAISGDGRFVAFTSYADTFVPGDCCTTEDGFVHDRSAGTTVRVTEDPAGVRLPNGKLLGLSGDGSKAVLGTAASNLGPPDVNGLSDIYVRDLATGVYTLVSVDSQGAQANGSSPYAQISRDGRFVVFGSDATNLVANDTNSVADVFVRDLLAGTTERVNVRPSGAESVWGAYGGLISEDGRYVVFDSFAPDLVPGDTNQKIDVFLRDRLTGSTRMVSRTSSGVQSDATCFSTSLSSNGRWVTFRSYATTLVPGDDPLQMDQFAGDTQDGSLARISVASDGTAANGMASAASVSASGLVAMVNSASNLVPGDSVANYEVFTHPAEKAIVSTFCAPKVNSQLCTAYISVEHWMSVSSSAPFVISTSQLINQKSGLLFYGSAPTSIPFQGGTLCVLPPLKRLPVQNTGGSPTGAVDCSGTLSVDFSAWVASGADPALTVGAVVAAQFYYRDPWDWDGFGTGLSDGVWFEVLP